MAGTFEGVTALARDALQWIAKAGAVINSLRAGDINSTQRFTLTPNAGSTVLTDPNLTPAKTVLFDPLTSRAAIELHGGGMYVTDANRGVGAWTITHTNSSISDRSFVALIMGG